MGVFTFTTTAITSPVAAARLFHAFCIDNQNLFPKVMPQFVKSVDLIQGDSAAVGCIRQINLADGAPFKYMKNRVEEIDTSKLYVKYTTFEGDVLRDFLECAVYEHTYEPSGDGTQYKMVGHFHTKGDKVMTEEDVAKGNENVEKIFKIVEEYLIANPQVYA